jgi:putative RecB family exonuclease
MTADVLDGALGAEDAEPRAPSSLSPSRASDFLTCPLLYRFRVIDRLPERPSPAATRGTVVHAVLERLFDLPAAERTPAAAHDMVVPQWERLLEEEPELAELFLPVEQDETPPGDAPGAELPDAATPDGSTPDESTPDDPTPSPEARRDAWLQSARDLLDSYFELEDPSRLEPAERELFVEHDLESGLRLRGYVDRLDVAPTGALRVVDYKTGRAPREGFEAKAMFQMRFYALVLWRLRGEVPRLLQLLYLGSGEILRYEPDEADLRATERKVEAVWAAIQRATDNGDWRPNPTRLCDWCDHQALCPAYGGTPPELPVLPVPSVPEARDATRPAGGLPDDERPSPHTPGDEV